MGRFGGGRLQRGGCCGECGDRHKVGDVVALSGKLTDFISNFREFANNTCRSHIGRREAAYKYTPPPAAPTHSLPEILIASRLRLLLHLPLPLAMRCPWRPLSALLRPALLPRSALGVPVTRRAVSRSQVLAHDAPAPTGAPEHIRPLPAIRPRLSLPLGADRSFENHKQEVTVEIDGEQHSFDALFLRDLCPCPKCLDPSTRQKLLNTTDIPDEIVADSLRIKPSGQLEVIWSEPEEHPHVSFYEPEVLLQYSSPERKRHFRNPAGRQVYWDGEMMRDNILRVDYKSFLESDEVLHRMLVQIHRFGLAYFVNVPSENTDGTEIARIAERFGDIKRTFYGKTWDVKSVPQSKNIAYIPTPPAGGARQPPSIAATADFAPGVGIQT